MLRAKWVYDVTKFKKPHTIVELIKPCALEMLTIIPGNDTRKKFETVLL